LDVIEELQHRMREEGIEVSQTGAANYYAELREAGVVDFTGWDAEGNPEFVVTPMGEEVFCPECGAIAADATDHMVQSAVVLECERCGTSWHAHTSAIDALSAFEDAAYRLADEDASPAKLPSPDTPRPE
jgi:hypothetical protein